MEPWFELAENPLAVTNLYTEVPLLDRVRFLRTELSGHYGIKIWIQTKQFPDKPPRRWQGCNVLTIELLFYGPRAVRLTGDIDEQEVRLQIQRENPSGLRIWMAGSKLQVEFHCSSFRIHQTEAAILSG